MSPRELLPAVILPVDIEIANAGHHLIAVEHEWLDTEGLEIHAPEDSKVRLRIIVTVMNDCKGEA